MTPRLPPLFDGAVSSAAPADPTRTPKTVTVSQIDVPCREVAIADLADRIDQRLRHIEQQLAIVPILLLGCGVDPTHVSVELAAEILGVSATTIRRRVRRGDLVLETVPGTRKTGIPIESLCERWIPLRVAKSALRRERASARLHGGETHVGQVEG